MRNHRFMILGVTGLVCFLTWLCISHLQADQDNAIRPNSELVKAAEGALKATRADYDVLRATVEDIYQWSRRLMEAEQSEGNNAAAVADHVARMRKLHDKVTVLYKAGARGGSERDYYATNFYLLESEANQTR